MTHVFQESLKDTTGLLVDETGDTLYTTSASKTANSRLGNTLDVITKDFALQAEARMSVSGSSTSSSDSGNVHDAWHHPFRDLFHLFRGQTCFQRFIWIC
jgi:hypothetical protein